MTRKLWGVKEVAEYLGLSVGTIYQFLSANRLPCVRISARCVKFDPAAIEEWVSMRSEKPDRDEFRANTRNGGRERRARGKEAV
jgi:excisionase family DNA binding protein